MRYYLFAIIVFWANKGFSQNGEDFYIEFKTDPKIVQTVQNQRGVNTFMTSSFELSEFLNNQNVLSLEKAYPTASSERLQRIYKLKLRDSSTISAFKKRLEVVNASPRDKPDLSNSYPNDYLDKNGNPDPGLQLVRAPQAWQITKGDSAVVVGIVDRGYDREHEELEGKIVSEIKLGNESSSNHGTGVAGILAGNTNNGKGFASIGYHTKLAMVTGTYPLERGLDSISKVPGIRIINASWGFCNASGKSKSVERLDSIIEKVRKRDVLVVAAAGNGKNMRCKLNEEDRINGYRYPASYDLDNVISVTSVGNKYPYGHYSDKYKKTGWRDCHENNPFTDDPSLLNKHTHNDRVDITAPGIRINMIDKGNTYKNDVWATSGATPFVAGAAALMLAVNPDLTAREMKTILLNTADNIYHLPCNQKYKGVLGEGRLNAYRAVLTAKCMKDPNTNLNLMIRDAEDDFGAEPYAGNNYGWQSPDIWIRNQDDGQIYLTSQSAKYKRRNKNYVYVRVTNTSCQISSGKEEVTLYWGKTEDNLEKTFQSENGKYKERRRVLGEEISTKKIPSLRPGEEKIIEIPWEVPNPKKYKKSDNPNAFYLLAEINSDQNEINYNEDQNIVDNIINNNNLAWKEVEVK